MKCPKLLLGAALLASICLLTPRIDAAPAYWDVNGSTAGSGAINGSSTTWDASLLWNAAADGTGSTASWVSGNTAVFAAGTDATGIYTVNISGTQEVSGLGFEEGTFTLSGGTIGIGTAAGGIANINVASGLIATINSILAGNPTGATTILTKTGAGTLVLGGANTFGGTGKRLSIQEGVLSFSSNGNLGNTANALDLGTSTTTATLRLIGATSTSVNRAIALGSLAGNIIEITNAGTVLTLSGVVSGGPGNSNQTNPGSNVAFTVRGAGTLELSGTANTFTGDIVIDGATYNVNVNSDWGNATVANSTSHTITLINGGKMALNTTATVNPGNNTTSSYNLVQIGTGGGTIDVVTGGTLQLDDVGQFFGSGVLTKTGAGILWLGNAFTGYTGGQVNLNGGTLQLQNSQALGATGAQAAIIMAAGTTLNLRTAADANFGSNVTLTGNATIAPGRSASSTSSITHTLGTLTMGSNTLTISLGGFLSTNAVGSLTFGATNFTGNAILQLDNVQGTGVGITTLGAIDGGAVARTITKQGLGSLTLAADATSLVAGSEFIVKSGILRINAGGALGAANLQLGDTSGALNTTLNVGVGGITIANNITVNSGSTGTMTIGGIFGSNTTSILTGNISLGSNVILTSASSGTVRFDGVISEAGGARSINKTGAGAVELTGANTFSGPITVTAGTLSFTSVGNVGAGASALGAPTTVANGTLNLAGGRLRYNGTATGGHSTDRNFNMTASSTIEASGVGALTLTGTLNATAGSLTFDGGIDSVGNLNNATTWTSAGFIKAGAGTWNLNGATSTTGTTSDWQINLGTINANATDSLNAVDDVIIDGDGNADSAIVNLNAVDVFSGDAFYIRNGGRVNVTVNDAFSGTDVAQLLVGDSASSGAAAARLHLGNPASTSSTANISLGANGLQLGASSGNTGRITGKGIITSTGTFSLRNGSIDADITLAGTGGITKVGNGTVTFAGTRTATGNTAIQEGELILDYATNNASKIGGVLTLGATSPNLVGGGTLTMNGIAGGTTTETMTSTTISAGASGVQLNAGTGGNVELNLGALTRTSVGGTVAFTYDTTNAFVKSATMNTFLGYATLTTGGTTRFAATNGTGNIVQAATTAKSDIGTWVGTDNVISTGAFTGQVGNRASIINSLTFDAAVANTISSLPHHRLTISSGGILVNDSVGANNTVISGGQLAGSATAPLGELIIHQNNTGGSLEIASNIVNSAGITKSGLGELILSGYNSFASSSTLVINEGRVTARGGNAIGDTTIVHMKQGTILAIGDGDTETVGRLGIDTSNPSHGTIALGNGSRLNINQGSSATFSGVFTGGANTTITKTGNGNLQLLGNSSGFTGKVEVNGGLLYLSGASGKLSGVTSFTLNKGSVFMIDNDDDSSPSDRISSSASFTLNSTDGFNSGETKPRGLTIRSDNNGDETQAIGALTFGSGSSYGYLEADAGGTSAAVASIVASNFIRNVGATMNVRGTALGTSSISINRGQLKIADGANEVAFLASNNLVGGSGTVGASAKNVKIVPWAIGEATTGGPGDNNMGNTFLTYVDNRGFVPLDLGTEYRTFGASGTGEDNVREILSTGLTGITGQTINSLVLHDSTADAGTQAFTGTGAGQALTVTSGGFLFTMDPLATGSSAHVINVGGFDDGIKVGTTNEYLFFVVNPTSTSATPTLTVNVSSPLNSAAASLTKAGRGTLVLSGTNSYGGGTYINEGVLQISGLANLGTGGINFAGGTLRLGAGFAGDLSTRTISTTSAGGFIDTNGINTVWANGLDITGTGPVAKTGNGMMTIQGASTYTGTFVVGHSSSTTAANAGVSQGVLLNGVTNQTITGNLQVGSTVLPGSGIAGVALGADEQIANTSVIIFNGASSRFAYFKMLGHSETVAGISDVTGSGVLQNRDNDVVTSGATLTLNSDDNYSYNGYLRDSNTGGADANALSLVKLGSGTQTLSGNQIRYSGGTTVSGGVLYLLNTTVFNSGIQNDATVVFDYTSGTALTLNRDLSGSGTYIKRGTGTVEWNGNNTFSGSVTVEGGVLSFSSGLGNNAASNNIRILEGATLRSTGIDVTLGVNQDIDLGGSVANIDVAGSATNQLALEGTLSGAAHTTFQKQGVGRLILKSANSYQGATNVVAGTLDLRHAAAIASSSQVTVANGAGLVFNASASGPAVDFTFSGTGSVLTLGTTGGSATLGFGINGATNDKLILSAGQTLSIGGTNVLTDIYINGAPTLSSYNLIQSAGTMDFSKFTLGTIFNPGSYTYSLNTSGTNNLVLNITAATAPSIAYWKGDLSGTGTGVWSAYQIGANPTNWDTDAASGIDTGVVPGANTDVFFTANGANTYTTTLGSDIAVRGVTFMAGSGTGGNNTTVSGPHTLTLGAGGITLAAGSGSINISAAIAMATGQTWHVADAGATLTASGGLSGTGNFAKTGLGTVTLSGNNSYTGTTTISAGTLQIGAGGITGTLGAGNVTNNGTLIIDRAGTYALNYSISGTGSLIKRGSGSLTLNVANTYGGSTTIENGSVLVGANNALPSTTALTLGAGATVGSLDLGTTSQSVASLTAVSNSNSANVVNIATGQSLTVNGNLVLANAANGANTVLNFTGGGSLNVTGAAANIRIAEAVGTSIASKATLDLSGLSNFTASLGTGALTVGSVGDNNGAVPSVMRLATNNSITAATVTVGGSGSGNTQSLFLGSGTNNIRTNTLNIGTGGRDGGFIGFEGASGTFSLQTAAAGRVNINMGTGSANTGFVLNTTLALAGHQANLLVNNMVIGTQPRNGNATHLVTFDQGTFDMNSLTMSARTGTGGTNSANKTITTNFNVGGGRVDIRNGISQMSQVTVTNASYNGAVSNSTFTVTGGEVYVGATGGTSVTMASATASHTATAIFDLLGGMISFTGDIVKGGGAGTTSAVVNLDGGTLEMNSRFIGSSTNAVTFNAKKGTLRNLGELNGGGALTKTTTDVLNVEGANYYTGTTNVTDGTFNLVNASLLGNGQVVVSKSAPLASTAVLSGTGTISGAVTLGSTTPGDSGILRPGTNLGTGHGTLTIAGDLTVNSGSQIQMSLGASTLVSEGFKSAWSNGTVTNALDYLQQNSSEVLMWNVAPAEEGDSDYISLVGAVSTPSVGDRASGAHGNGSIVVSIGSGFSAAYGSVFNLMDWLTLANITGGFDTGAFTMYDASGNVIAGDLDLPTLGAGMSWDVSAFSQYGILVVVPEPGRAMLFVFGVAALFMRRRRAGR